MTTNARFVLGIAELFGRHESRVELRTKVQLDGLELTGSALRSSVVDGRLALDLLLERSGPPVGAHEVDLRVSQGSRVEGVLVSGTARGRWSVPCRRCLESTQGDLVVEVDECFELAHRDGETWPLQQQSIDLGPMLRELVLVTLPLAPLCARDCEGPAPDRFPTGTRRDETPSGDPRETSSSDPRESSSGDPRWSVLDELTFDN